MNETNQLTITVKEIRGKCPVLKVGDKIVVKETKIVLRETNVFCIHAFGSMTSMITAVGHDVSFKELGLATKEGNVGYIQCLDPRTPYTDGETVIF